MAVAPSFNCARARLRAEKAICANPEVAALDNEMAALYVQIRRGLRGSKRRALIERQKQWLKQRNSCRSDIACLIRHYQTRIRQLQ